MIDGDILYEGGKKCPHGNPLDLEHLSVDKKKIRDIIDNYEGVKHIHESKHEVNYHPV